MEALSIAIDPRGVRAVAPSGDRNHDWIKTDDPTGAWHYREWQWWKGHPWGDSCRPRYYADVKLSTSDAPKDGAVISYRIDGFDCRQEFILPKSVERDVVYWDVLTTIRNETQEDVEEYGQFFACYTPLNRGRSFWYWDASDELVLFSDRGVTHLDGYIVHPEAYFAKDKALPHCPRGGGKIVGHWANPVMVSHPSPGGWRSIIFIEPKHAASLAQGIYGGAMDYVLFPGAKQRTFQADTSFTARIRHIMLLSPELPTLERLKSLWQQFLRSHDTVQGTRPNR